MMQSTICKATNEQLIQWLANAMTTSALAGGHGKGMRNEQHASDYRDELLKRTVMIPSSKELYAIGQFNGEGAS